MLCWLNLMLFLATLGATTLLYAVSYDARRLEAQVQAEEHQRHRLLVDIAVLSAERAHLARPERLEPLARELGLAPIGSGQYLRIDAREEPSAPSGGSREGSAAPAGQR
jgi:cell division protein FtsL